MTDPTNIQDELNNLNSGLPVNKTREPFTVPEGYFDGLAASILAKAKAQALSAADELAALSPLLASLPKALPYRLPPGYFDENLSVLSSLVLETESPVLAAIGNQVPYTVPQGYFETLPQQVLNRLAPQAKLVSLFGNTWMRAAVAAVMGGIIFLSGYRYFNHAEGLTASQLPVDTSKNWMASNKQPVVQDLKNASTQELEEFINNVPVASAKPQKAVEKPTEKKVVKDLLKDVSEKEMDAFLEQLPSGEDDLALIN